MELPWVTRRPRAEKEVVIVSCRLLARSLCAVWERQSDGSWKISKEMWTTEQPQ